MCQRVTTLERFATPTAHDAATRWRNEPLIGSFGSTHVQDNREELEDAYEVPEQMTPLREPQEVDDGPG